jgi:hypothetical protein
MLVNPAMPHRASCQWPILRIKQSDHLWGSDLHKLNNHLAIANSMCLVSAQAPTFEIEFTITGDGEVHNKVAHLPRIQSAGFITIEDSALLDKTYPARLIV